MSLVLALNVLLALAGSFIFSRLASALGVNGPAAWIWTSLLMTPIVLWSARSISSYLERALESLSDGMRAFRDGDFSMRLAAQSDDQVSTVKRLYNDVADALRTNRSDVFEKELLLDTILQRTPIAVLLLNADERVLYYNGVAREFLGGGDRLEGRTFHDIAQTIVGPMRDALLAGSDAIVVVPVSDHEETFHLTQRTFRLNTMQHRLILVERLTSELRRQEVAVWKKAIRVINHELNNTIAPISSLFHSAKLALAAPERHHRLQEIYETIDDRLAHLRTFLDSYAQFARLVTPRREWIQWSEIVADVHALYEFQIKGDTSALVYADRAQLQQVLINLVKNAHESGGDPEEIVVAVQPVPDGALLRVLDRGRGMSAEVMRQALLPFYSTKPSGSGLGLPLCNEIVEAHGGTMRLQSRSEGTVVTIWLPKE